MRILLLGFVMGTLVWIAMVCVPSPMLTPAQADTGTYWTPQVGDPDRKAILDTLRPPVEQASSGPVQFVVNTLRTDGHWAFVSGTPQRPDGQPIDWTGTPLADERPLDLIDQGAMGLMARSGDQWQLVEVAVGPTDVPWTAWADHHALPYALFQAGH